MVRMHDREVVEATHCAPLSGVEAPPGSVTRLQSNYLKNISDIFPIRAIIQRR